MSVVESFCSGSGKCSLNSFKTPIFYLSIDSYYLATMPSKLFTLSSDFFTFSLADSSKYVFDFSRDIERIEGEMERFFIPVMFVSCGDLDSFEEELSITLESVLHSWNTSDHVMVCDGKDTDSLLLGFLKYHFLRLDSIRFCCMTVRVDF